MRGPKSCLHCRKSKQRCDIPDREAITPSTTPQPIHLACHRCKVLQLPCTIDFPVLAKRKRDRLKKRRSVSPHPPPHLLSPLPHQEVEETSRHHSSSSRASPSANGSRRVATFHARAPSQEGRHEVQNVFDPNFSGYADEHTGDNNRPGKTSHDFGTSYPSQQHTVTLSDITEKLRNFRPFPYLFRLCYSQPDFLAPLSKVQTDSRPLSEIIGKHTTLIDWEEMNVYLKEYEVFLPFLEPFNIQDPVPPRAGIYLATSLYLAALRTDLTELQVDLLVYLRQQAHSCVLRGPSNAGEAAALVALALYEPLLLARTVEEMQLDGSGLLAAASIASKVLDLERMPSVMRSFDLHSNRDPTGLLRQCSLWVTIAFYSTLNSLAGDSYRRPLLEASLQDLNDVEIFCKRSLEVPGAAQWSGQVSLLLILIFRYRTLRDFQEIARSQLDILEALPITPYDRAEACIGEGVSRSFACANDVLNRLQALRHRLSLPEQTSDILMDFVELEIGQLHMLCILNFTEACIFRIAASYGQPSSLQVLVQRIMQDERAVRFTATVGIPKTDLSMKLSTLVSNFAARWSLDKREVTNHRRDLESSRATLALPPAHVCAMILFNIKSLADHVGGTFQLGNNPRNCLDDREVGIIVQLCRGHAESLRRFSTPQNDQLYQAKGHSDIFCITSGIALRTSNAIYEWAATSKGLRSAMRPSRNPHSVTLMSSCSPSSNFIHESQTPTSLSHQSFNPTSTAATTTANTTAVASTAAADNQDFERLLAEILSTPILYS